MSKRSWSDGDVESLKQMALEGLTSKEIADRLGRSVASVTSKASRLGVSIRHPTQKTPHGSVEESISIHGDDNSKVVVARTTTLRTQEEVLAEMGVDLKEWMVERSNRKKWDALSKIRRNGQDQVVVVEMWQINLWLKRRIPHDVADAIRGFVRLIEEKSIHVPRISNSRSTPSRQRRRRSLEIDIMDPHLGLVCHPPESDVEWNLDLCEQACLESIDELIEAASHHGPYEEIVFPFGNDFLHHDNVQHTTTAGTPQPEADSWHNTYLRGQRMAVTIVDRLKEVAPVRVIEVPGNHDRQSSFTLGLILDAWYRNDENVTVDVSSSPYKFYKFGVNLIGFDHGRSVKPQRLAALMANETRRTGWADALYCEWHLGDQHRKGVSSLVMLEEQGVSIEYLSALTPPNAWSRLHGYNHQKRGATAFVWDYDSGPVARLHVSLDPRTSRPLRRSTRRSRRS